MIVWLDERIGITSAPESVPRIMLCDTFCIEQSESLLAGECGGTAVPHHWPDRGSSTGDQEYRQQQYSGDDIEGIRDKKQAGRSSFFQDSVFEAPFHLITDKQHHF